MNKADLEAIESRKQFFIKHKKLLLIIGASLLALVIIILVSLVIYRSIYNAKLKVVVAPFDAKIMVSGKSYKNGEHRIKPGHYEVKITREGFTDYEKTLDIEAKGRGEIYVCMDSTDGADWYSTDERYAKLCDEVYEHDYDVLMKEKYSDKIFSITPFHSYDKGFNIDTELDDESGEVAIIIEPLSCRPERIKGLEKNAIEWLEKAGIETSKYKIVYNESCLTGE